MCAGFKAGQSKNGGIGWEVEQAPTLSADCSGTEPTVFDARGNGNGKTAPTITGDHQNRVTDYTAICIGNGQADQTKISDKVGALNCMHDQQAVITYGLDRAAYNQGKNAKYWFSVDAEKIGAQVAKGPGAVCAAVDVRNGTENTDINGTIQAKSNGGYNSNCNTVCRQNAVVRRLTPMECERLQGFPDHWSDIGEWIDTKGKRRKTNDSQRYRALGNSLALPFWAWLAERICEHYDRPVEMASLFDGIGGFPLVFERAGAKAVWASEVEEFCIAVTKRRFPE